MNKKQPLVTIGVPVYNGYPKLKQSLQSLFSQRYNNLEIIISDDHSTDKTASIVRSFMKKNSNVRYIRHPKRLKLVKNFNAVLKKARGTYFLWHAYDDKRKPNAIQILVDLLERHPDATLAASNVTLANESTRYTYSYPFDYKTHSLHALRLFLRYPHTVTSLYYGMYRTDFLRKIGGTHDTLLYITLGSTDTLTVFQTLLHGSLVFSDRVLFEKGDSGHYIDKYEVLWQHLFSPDVLKKIIRYFFSPVGILYGGTYMTLYTVKSSHTIKNKIRILSWIVNFTIRGLVTYFARIGLGVWFALKGFMPKGREKDKIHILKKKQSNFSR